MLLQLDRINYTLPNCSQPLLSDISFNLIAGERITITGVTGAGKTTLLRLLNGLIAATSGQILLDGENCQTISPSSLRRRLMLISQEPKLLGMKVREALAYPLQLQKLSQSEIEQRIVTITEQFQLDPDWFELNENQLSAGQKQIVSIVRGVIIQPQVLLLDEPIANLDFITGERILTLLTNIARTRRMAIIAINHQLELATQFSDRILYLQAGKLEFDRVSTAINWQQIQQQIRTTEQALIAEWE